jgi:hypothetical protein
MILAISSMWPRQDKIHVVRDNECETWRSDFTERKAEVPQVLLVEQQIPESHILPHFHGSDQFQVFMDGYGRLGNHAISPIAVHYTNAWTGYGPIVAGEKGMSYYVLRPGLDVLGSQYMHVPESRQYMRNGPKRFLLAENIKCKSKDELLALKEVSIDRVIDLPADDKDAGVFAHVVSLGPHMTFTGADPRLSGGQMVVVIEGSVTYNGQDMRARSGIAITNDEDAVTVDSDEQGAQFLFLQYAKRQKAQAA